MQHSNLIQIIRRQHLPRLVFPLIMIIVSVVFIISNPFKKALTPHMVDSLDAIDSLYENGEEYIKCTIDKMYYTGYDYVKGNKKKAGIYYTFYNGICYYIIYPTGSTDKGTPAIIDGATFPAKLQHSEPIYDDLVRNISEMVNFTEDGLKSVSCDLFINSYAYNTNYSRFMIIGFMIIALISLIFLILLIIAAINPNYSSPVRTLKKYGDYKTLFAIAVTEYDTAVAVGRKNVFITDTFLIIITKTDTVIIPLENITWVYDYNEVYHKKGNTIMYHPLCIVTDTKKIYKIRHVSEKGIDSIVNTLLSRYPEIMTGCNN